MSRMETKGYTWLWRRVRNPENGGRSDVGIDKGYFWGHLRKHLYDQNEPWEPVLGDDLLKALKRQMATTRVCTSECDHDVDEANKRLEVHVRAGLEHPMVLICYSADSPDELRWTQFFNWHIVTPAGAEAIIRKGELVSAMFRGAVYRSNHNPRTWARSAAVFLHNMVETGLRLDANVVVAGKKHMAGIRFESPQNWASFNVPSLVVREDADSPGTSVKQPPVTAGGG